MRGYTWVGTATDYKTEQQYIMYGRKGIVTLYEKDKENEKMHRTNMSFEMSSNGMIGFANEHRNMRFTQTLTH